MRSFGVVITVYLLAFKQLSGQCVKGDCYNGEGTYKAKMVLSIRVVSEWGNFNGRGTVRYASNDYFVGIFRSGKKEGSGKYVLQRVMSTRVNL